MALNKWYLAAGSLMGLTLAVHVFAGGPEVYGPIRAADFSPELIAVLSVIWHAITAILAIMCGALLWLGLHNNPALTLVLLATNVAFILLFLGYGLADLGTVWPMPQWVAFAVVVGLMLIGQRRRA